MLANKALLAVAHGRAGLQKKGFLGGEHPHSRSPRQLPSLAQEGLAHPRVTQESQVHRRQRAAAPAGTQLSRSSRWSRSCGPGPILGAAGSPGLGQPGLPTLGTSGSKPGRSGSLRGSMGAVSEGSRPSSSSVSSPDSAQGSGPGLTAAVT